MTREQSGQTGKANGKSGKWSAPAALVLAFWLPAVHAAAPAAGEPTAGVIGICEDSAEWPPYTFVERVHGKPAGRVRGAAVDILDAIFGRRGIRYRIDMLPWARCLRELELGTRYQMVLNASWSTQRHETFLLSQPVYTTTNYYFYSRRQHPRGLSVARLADLGRYRVCGLLGYNYETYGLAPDAVDQGTRDFTALIAKLHAGRCDLFLEKREVLAGFAAIGHPYLEDPDLAGMPVPGMQPTPFHMMVSKQAPNAQALLDTLNDGLTTLRASGELERILRSYLR